MQEALKQIKAELLTGTQNLFQEVFGFPLKQLTNQALPPVKFLKDEYNPAAHRIIQTVYLAGFIGKESLTEIGETSDSALKSASRYPGMLLLAVELDSVSPSYTEIQKLTTAFNRATPAMPVTLLYRYNKGSRIALASCERFEYKQKRTGERIGKTAILMDIDLQKASHTHKQILSSLKIEKMPKAANEVESVLEHWRDRFRCRNTDFLLELAREWTEANKTIPPIEQVEKIFGPQAITTIRNNQNWACYYNFLKDACDGETQAITTLENAVSRLIQKQIKESVERHSKAPSVTQIHALNKLKDLHLFKRTQIAELIKASTHNNETGKTQLKEPDGSPIPPTLKKLAEEAQHALEQGINLKEISEESDENDEEDKNDNELPLAGPDLEEIEVSQSALEAGEYDDLPVCKYSIPKNDHTFVFDKLVSLFSTKTIGDLRQLEGQALLEQKNCGQKQVEKLEALKGQLLSVAQKKLFEQVIDQILEVYPEEDLDFEINYRVMPRKFMPIGTPQPNTLLKYYREKKLHCSALKFKKTTISDFIEAQGLLTLRIKQFIEIKRALPYLIQTNKALLAFEDKAKNDSRIIRRDKLSDWERITADKVLWLVDDTYLRVKHLTYDLKSKRYTANTPKIYHLPSNNDSEKGLTKDDYRISSIKQKVARAVAENDQAFFFPNDDNPINLTDLENRILEHLENCYKTTFYKNQDRLLKAILLARRGFTKKQWTLQSIADQKIAGVNKRGEPLSRERIRQHQVNASRALLWSLPLRPAQISKTLEGFSTEQVSLQMSRLSEALHNSLTRFRRFIGFIAQDLSILLDVENTLLNHFFATTPGPVPKEHVLHYIREELKKNDEEDLVIRGNEDAQAGNIFETLVLRKILSEDKEGQVYPSNLKPKEAVAHIFASCEHPLTIDDGINISKSANVYPEAKKDQGKSADRQLINANPYLFLSGVSEVNSLYRHIRYLPRTNGEELIQWLDEYIEDQEADRIDLRQAYQKFDSSGNFGYYAFRHYIREFAQEEGFELEWDGKSKVDNLKVKGSTSKRITNKDRVLRLVKAASTGMTLEEVASEFHCHSQALVGQGLSALIDEGKVWKVSPRLYTTPKAFKSGFDADEEEAFKKIKSCLTTLLNESGDGNRLLDASFFAQIFNTEQTVGFHKNFFISYARSAKGVYTSRSLISSSPIEYDSIAHLFDYHLRDKISKEEAIAQISEHILASGQALEAAYQGWFHRLKNGLLRAKKKSAKNKTLPSRNSSEIESANKITPQITFGEPAGDPQNIEPHNKSEKPVLKASAKKAVKESKRSVKPSIQSGTQLKESKQKASKKPASNKTTAKKKTTIKAAKKAPVKKAPVKKAPVKKAPVKKAPAKKAPVKKAPAKKAPVKKAPAKKAPVKKAPAKKAPVKKAPAKKAPAKKRVTQPAPVNKQKVTKKAKKSTNRHSTTKKKVAKQAPTKKAATKKKVAKKAANKKVTAKKTSTRKSPISKKAVAKKTPSKKTDKKREKKDRC